jgi:hypothetical protein
MCGVLEKTCGSSSILEGLDADTARITDDLLAWARDTGIELSKRGGFFDRPLFAKDLTDVCDEKRFIPPGTKVPSSKTEWSRTIGQALQRLSTRGAEIDLGAFTILTGYGEFSRPDGKGKQKGWKIEFRSTPRRMVD